MFGLSFGKVMVLVAVIAVIWFGFRWFQRWEKEQAARNANAPRAPDRSGDARQLAAEDMVACSVCGAYVAPSSATSCGKANCPYPRR